VGRGYKVAYYYSRPDSLAATSVSSSEIDLTWSNNETTAQIEIQRRQSGGAFSTIGTCAASESSYSDTSCSSNTLYTYRVRYNDGGSLTSNFSIEDNAYSYPAAPTALAAAWSGITATLSWVNSSVYTYIRVYYKLSSEPTAWTTDTTALSGTATTRNIAVATESTAYDFRIRGYNSTSTLLSDYITITSQTSGVVAPTDLVLSSVTTTSVKLDWTDNSSVEDGYEVYYKLSSGSTYTLFETTAADATTSTVTGLTASSEYDYRVRAKDGTSYSSYLTGTLTAGVAPDADPSITTVTVVSSSALTPNWTCAATNEDGFYVYRSLDNTTYTQVGTADADETSYADTGLAADTVYYYKVRAYNTQGVSALTSEAHNTTSLDLDPPTSMIADALSSTQIKISFTVNADSATNHRIERRTSTSAYAEIGNTASGTIATYTDGTCSANTEYTYRIRAYHSTPATYGDYSVPISKATLNIGTDSVRRNEAFVALGNILYVASETPQTSISCYWRSKPIDFIEVDQNDSDKIKVIDRVTLDYKDNYSSVPVIISVSNDGGTNWSTSSLDLGTATTTEKSADFFFSGAYCVGKYLTVRVASVDTNTNFAWTGITIHYRTMGDYYNPA
jgi:hypothetical protein